MRKIYSIVLMAAGLLIGTQGWAQLPQRSTPLVEPQGFQMNSDINGSVQKAPMRKLAQDAASQQVKLEYGSFSQTFTGDRALQDAFDSLPANSTPAFVTLLTDVNVPTTQTTVTMAQYHNVTLDLNGHNVYGVTNVTGSAAVITNNGTLTIEDKVGGGSISNLEENPEDYEAAEKPYPSYAYNVITNYGTLIINGGYFVNYTNSNSSYVVDNNSTARSAKFIMNGGTLENQTTNAIRQFCNSTKNTNDVIINDGLVYGYCPIWMQSTNTNKNVGSLTINGGEIRSHANCYVNGTCSLKGTPDYIYNYGSSSSQDYSAMSITITGGTFNVNLNTYGNIKTRVSGGVFNANFKASTTDTQISGGEFYFDASETESYSGYGYQAEQYYPDYDADYLRELGYSFKEDLEGQGYTVIDMCEYNSLNDCGIWWACFASAYSEFYSDKKGWIAEGHCTKRIGVEPDRTILVSLCSKDTAAISGDMNAEDLKDEKSEPIELTETTDLIINNTGENAKITFNEDATVNNITVTSEDGAPGEAQIVVKDGATLNVGNGGIVSENDVLTTVLVESGGTLIIGTGGIDQQGDATPIEIKASEENGTGTLIFSPNTSTQDTKKYAEVDLYTYCKKVGDKYYWQQFAIPVTDLDNSKVVKTPNETSYVFEWDYATYGWSQLSDWNQLDKPFAGYDMTNVSENGGVVYTFKGNLIGNQNIQLTLPHSDYCVMGNSYTAPISIAALFEQISKEMTERTIEKTVYKYDAKAGYYVYTNELEQTLSKLGITNAAFTDIKPMEGFLLNLQQGNTAGVMLNYANAVFKPATTTTVSSAPARTASTTDLTIAKIMVKSDNYTDAMTLIEGEEFSSDIENGKDAYKYINQEGINLYAFNNNDKLAMVASDNIEGTNIAFQSSNDENYTLTFSNVINSDYELLDMQTNIRTPMVEGASYTFTATPNTLNPARFMVVTPMPAMPTDAEQVKESNNVKGVYTILGQYLCEAENWSELPKGVYIVNGVKIVK